jgi:hypothetical protein
LQIFNGQGFATARRARKVNKFVDFLKKTKSPEQDAKPGKSTKKKAASGGQPVAMQGSGGIPYINIHANTHTHLHTHTHIDMCVDDDKCVWMCVCVCVGVAASPSEAKAAIAPYVLGYWNTRVSTMERCKGNCLV